MDDAVNRRGRADWRDTCRRVAFDEETPVGKVFDIILILTIISSVVAVMLDSVSSISSEYGDLLYVVEWIFTLLFTIEYALRFLCAIRPWIYARSFFGFVDLLAIMPTYLSLLLPGTEHLAVIRLLRVLRVFRVLKLAQYLGEANLLTQALHASRRKVTVFLATVLILVMILGSTMYVIEGGENGFSSIPHSVYWAIVTLTTVGYGDVAPQTDLGKVLASVVMILGYGIIAVPTGIMTAELTLSLRGKSALKECPDCGAKGHDENAVFCKRCGGNL